jgi:hypothetical protein
MLSKNMIGANIYKRELFLNINHFQGGGNEQPSGSRIQNSGSKHTGTKDDNSVKMNLVSKNSLDLDLEMEGKEKSKIKSIKSAQRTVKNPLNPSNPQI